MERLTVRHTGAPTTITHAELPHEIRRHVEIAPIAASPRASACETLFRQIVEDRQSFWAVVYAPFMLRDLTRDDLRTLVGAGLQRTSGSYRELVELFNMPPADYKRFLNFLRKHQCHMPFQQFRGTPARSEGTAPGPAAPRRPLVASA